MVLTMGNLRGRAQKQVPALGANDISIFNFDAVEQARLWQKEGPAETVSRLVAAMRAALLLGETVHLDRNQLFEGIFFVAVSPDRLAWHLGIEPGGKLPLTVRMLGTPDREVTSEIGPWIQQPGSSLGWGVSDALVREIDANYAAVADDKLRVSSLRQALAYDAEELSREFGLVSFGAQSAAAPAHAPLDSDAEAQSRADETFLPNERWQRRTASLNEQLIAKGRSQWAHALKLGRLSVVSWVNDATDPVGPPNVAAVLEENLPSLPVHRPVALSLVRVTRDSANNRGTVRSLIVRWLNGERIDDLSPATLAEALTECGLNRETVSPEVLDLALSWWIRCYYRAIAARDGLNLYQFYAPVTGRNSESSNTKMLEVEWGLRPADKNLRARIVGWLGARPEDGEHRTYEVGGSVLERMRAYAPGQYARLRAYTRSNEKINNLEGRRGSLLADLALAVEDGAVDLGGRGRKLREGLLKAGALLVLGILLALLDNMNPLAQGVWLATLFFVAMGASVVPWGELWALVKLSNTGLGTKSTLEVAASASRV